MTNVVNCDPWRSIYTGPTGSARCAFPRTELNGSMPIISRDNHAGFYTDRYNDDLTSGFRS
jgi:hypothetical protein